MSGEWRKKGTLAFGAVMTDASRRVWLKNACDHLTRRVGVIVYPQLARSYSELADAVSSGTVEIAWTPPLVAADLIARRLATAVVVSRRDNAAQYRAVIFARRDSGVRTIQDLLGKHIAWVDRFSASGYIVPRAWLRDNGVSADEHFARQSFLGSHGAVARAVLRREVDAGATFALFSAGLRATVEAGWTEIDPTSADEVQMVVNAGTVPADCIAVSMRIADELRQRVAAAFLALDTDEIRPFRQALGAEGYEACPAGHADSLRRLQLEVSRAAPVHAKRER